MIKPLLISLLFTINLLLSMVSSAQPLHFALLSARDSQDAFWRPVEDFAQQAAKQLGVKISILHTRNSKRKMFSLLSKAHKLNVDAVIFANFGQIAPQLMLQADQHQLPVLLFNSDITDANKKLTGKPQQQFKYWLASLIPDDQQAGYLLGRYLIEQARMKGLTGDDGMVQIVAINGSIADTPAKLRLSGLKNAIKEDGNSRLLQSVYAHWSQETAFYKASRLAKRYPEASVYWTASDLMAIGVNQALTKKGLQQGRDYFTGGVDWSKEGLAAIKRGKISTSAGGHFMDGAWAVIMLYDHFNGVPLNGKNFYQFQSLMSLITAKDIELLLPRLQSHDWAEINFRLRSKAFNKQLREHNFAPTSVLDELRQTQ